VSKNDWISAFNMKFTFLLVIPTQRASSAILLEQAFFELKDNAAPGVDGLTWTDYETEPRAAQQKALRIGKVRSRSR
jgi:hypothetical protein